MLLASLDSPMFKILLLLHILAVIVAFAPAFVVPVLSSRYKKDGQKIPADLMNKIVMNANQIHGPSLVLAGLFGLGLVGTSSKVYEFSQPWVSVAFLLWFLMIGVLFGLLVPAEKKVAAGDESAEKLVAMAGGILHLLLLVMVIDMVWKFGL